MTLGQRRSRIAWRVLRVAIPLLACAALLGVLAFGYGAVPALGPALDPGRGVWTSASGGELPRSGTLSLPGLGHPVRVSFTSHGVPSVRAASPHDVFLAEGYLQARFRLAQMDLERRLGEGRLAQLAGPSAVSSDKFELRLGLVRTAEREWAQMPRSSPAAQDLVAYSRGVNDDLAQLRRDRQWPALFSLHSRQFPSLTQADALGYGPRAAGGDPFAVDAADGGLVASQGPSWRMITAWTGRGSGTAEGIYPGGQSENPASPWYEDQVADWWNGRYLPMPPAGSAPGVIRWTLRP